MVCNHVEDGKNDDDDDADDAGDDDADDAGDANDANGGDVLGAKCVGTRAHTSASHNPIRIGDGQ